MVQAVVSSEKVRELLLLRLIVAALGERSMPPWWKTQFLTDVGMRSMVRILPRTALSAALKSVSIVARQDHDKRIGVGGRYHLFRLPTPMERAMTSALSEESVQVQATAVMKEGQDGLMKALEASAGDRTVRAAEGPVILGKSEYLAGAIGLQELAAHYRDSFKLNRRAFPYFQDTEERA